jgi:hypothetical protein
MLKVMLVSANWLSALMAATTCIYPTTCLPGGIGTPPAPIVADGF